MTQVKIDLYRNPPPPPPPLQTAPSVPGINPLPICPASTAYQLLPLPASKINYLLLLFTPFFGQNKLLGRKLLFFSVHHPLGLQSYLTLDPSSQ